MKLILVLCLLSSSVFADYYQLRTKAKENKVELTEKELDVLMEGRVEQTQYVIGGILGTYPLGLGIGHAIQGRYSTDGWKFTVGELGSLAVAAIGLSNCDIDDCDFGLATAGLLGFVGFRIWEIIDVWATPLSINRKYDGIKEMIERSSAPKISYNIAPVISRDGGLGLGLSLKF